MDLAPAVGPIRHAPVFFSASPVLSTLPYLYVQALQVSVPPLVLALCSGQDTAACKADTGGTGVFDITGLRGNNPSCLGLSRCRRRGDGTCGWASIARCCVHLWENATCDVVHELSLSLRSQQPQQCTSPPNGTVRLSPHLSTTVSNDMVVSCTSCCAASSAITTSPTGLKHQASIADQLPPPSAASAYRVWSCCWSRNVHSGNTETSVLICYAAGCVTATVAGEPLGKHSNSG